MSKEEFLTTAPIDIYDVHLRLLEFMKEQRETNLELASNGLKVSNCLHSYMERQNNANQHFKDLYFLLNEEIERLQSISNWLAASALGTCACLIAHLVWGH
jgi:hypothetical protein